MFCVKCDADGETFGGLCTECFLGGKELITLPRYIDLERCASCEEFRVRGQWIKRSVRRAAEDMATASMSAIDGLRIISAGAMSEPQDERNFLVKTDITGELCGNEVHGGAETVVRIKGTVCRKCSRQLGNYYEATIQIRNGTKELSNEARDDTVRYVRSRVENLSQSNRQLFITRIREVQGGVDMLLSSIPLAKMLAKELCDMYGAESKESSKLVGKSPDGSDMHRMTYLVRMPEYKVNDIVSFEGKFYKLSMVSKGGGKLILLKNFNMLPIRRSQMPSLKVHIPSEELMKAVVVSRSKKEIQILHPENYSTVDLKIPENAKIKDTVNVAEIDGILFHVP